MEIEIQIINAFTDGESGGNPAGVVLDADKLSVSQKLKIAAKVGLSETAFVSSSKSMQMFQMNRKKKWYEWARNTHRFIIPFLSQLRFQCTWINEKWN